MNLAKRQIALLFVFVACQLQSFGESQDSLEVASNLQVEKSLDGSVPSRLVGSAVNDEPSPFLLGGRQRFMVSRLRQPFSNPQGSTVSSSIIGTTSPYRLEKWKEISIFGAAAGLWGAGQFIKVTPSCPCSSDQVNSFDRWAAGRKSDTATTVSNFFLAATLALPAVGLAWKSQRSGFMKDLFVYSETYALNTAVKDLVQRGVQRPRPLIYGVASGPNLKATDTYRSFYSGHSSKSFAIALSTARTYALRNPTGRRKLVYGIALALAGTTGALRIAAGKHFLSDVIVGSAVGSIIGWFVPAQHR